MLSYIRPCDHITEFYCDETINKSKNKQQMI